MIKESVDLAKAKQYVWDSSRDNVRTPMQWSSKEQAGFTKGVPWLKVNDNYPDINVETAYQDTDSVYWYYKKMIELRKSSETLIYGNYEIVEKDHETIYAYLRWGKRDIYLIVVNMFETYEELSLTNYIMEELVLANYKVTDELSNQLKIRPYEARVYKVSEREFRFKI